MPALTNTTIIKHATPICNALNEGGDNWNWKAQAALIVRFVLEESGNLELLGPEHKDARKEMANEIEKMGYPKNYQQVYLSKTQIPALKEDGSPILGKDGKPASLPLMPGVESKGEKVNEFV